MHTNKAFAAGDGVSSKTWFFDLARVEQLPPDSVSAWNTWAMIGDRGTGKTRAQLELIRREIEVAHEAGLELRVAVLVPHNGAMYDMCDRFMALYPLGERTCWYGKGNNSGNGFLHSQGTRIEIFSARRVDLRGSAFDWVVIDAVDIWDDVAKRALAYLCEGRGKVLINGTHASRLLANMKGKPGVATTVVTSQDRTSVASPPVMDGADARPQGS